MSSIWQVTDQRLKRYLATLPLDMDSNRVQKVSAYIGLLLLLLLGPTLQARHIVGGEITYRCLGDGAANSRRYEVTITVYRDCAAGGALFDSDPSAASAFKMTVFRGTAFVQEITIQNQNLKIERLNVDLTNPCIVLPPDICVERGVYTTVLELPITSEAYTLSYQRCCRNETISNIVAPGEAGATYLVVIPGNAQQACNATPTFKNFPPLVICADVQLEFDGSASDIEGDSLVYSLCEPYYGGGNITRAPGSEGPNGVTPNPETPPPYEPIVFKNSFSASAPLDGSFSLDSRTGLLRANPMTVGQYVVCVSVQEYRRGVLLSEVRRDFQFNVVACDPKVRAAVTALVGVDSVAPDLILVCGDKDVQLVDVSGDRRFINEIEWNIPGSSGGPTVSRDRTISISFDDYGTYPGQLIANPGLPCVDTALFNILLAPPSEVDLDFSYDTCIYAPVQFESEVVSLADSIVRYRWNFGDGQTSNQENPSHLYRSGGRRRVVHEITDNFGCRYESTKFLDYFPVPPSLDVSVAAANNCAPATFAFRQISELFTADYDIFWDFGDGNTSTELNPDYQFNEPGTYSIYVRATSPAGCVIDTQLSAPINILQSPIADFSFSPDVLDVRDAQVFFQDQSQFAVSWQWFFDSLGTSRELNPIFTFPDSGSYTIDLLVSHLNGCLDSTSAQLRVNPFQSLFVPNAFTPNDDGLNEVFKVAGYLRYVTDFEMQIFNRWGEQVFVGSDQESGWNGQNQRNGGKCSPGVYLFLITHGGLEGPQRLHGYVTLVE